MACTSVSFATIGTLSDLLCFVERRLVTRPGIVGRAVISRGPWRTGKSNAYARAIAGIACHGLAWNGYPPEIFG
jgi:hypothetical protein